jgi:hypothetical protein
MTRLKNSLTRLIPLEEEEQGIFIKWFRLAHPSILIFAIPNGGYRHKLTAIKLKKSGVVPGVPDIFIPKWKLWVEMKRIKHGSLTANQREIIEYLQTCGYKVIVARGFDDAKAKVEQFVANFAQN